jgi:hypothetical protein
VSHEVIHLNSAQLELISFIKIDFVSFHIGLEYIESILGTGFLLHNFQVSSGSWNFFQNKSNKFLEKISFSAHCLQSAVFEVGFNSKEPYDFVFSLSIIIQLGNGKLINENYKNTNENTKSIAHYSYDYSFPKLPFFSSFAWNIIELQINENDETQLYCSLVYLTNRYLTISEVQKVINNQIPSSTEILSFKSQFSFSNLPPKTLK